MDEEENHDDRTSACRTTEEDKNENCADVQVDRVMPYKLTVKLLEGHDLVVRDSSGSSDPFVKFKYNGKTLHSSKIIYKNLNPIWNEEFTTYAITDLSRPLKMVVKDFDRFAVNDFMGEAFLTLSTVELDKQQSFKFMLRGVTPDQYMGYILVNVTLSQSNRQNSECASEDNISQASMPLFPNILKKSASVRQASEVGNEEHVQSSPPIFSNLLKKAAPSTPPTKPNRRRYQANRKLTAVIRVVIAKAKRLLHTDSHANSPLPNPMVQLKLGSQTHSTKHAEKTLSPKWYEEFVFYLYEGDDEEQNIELSVIDKRKNVCMGKTWLELKKYDREMTHRKWCDLGDGAGSLFYLLTINVPSVLDAVDDINEESMASMETNFQDRYTMDKSLKELDDVGRLIVKVYKAQGLAAADLNGKSDPFCVLELVNSRLQTPTIYNTLHPQWNKLFTFHVTDIHSVLEITVLDEDANGQDDFLGRIDVPLINIKNKEKRWYALKDKKLKHRAKGQILLEFELFYNPVKAILRSFKPKEQKYTGHETKFKRSLFMRNLLRLKAFAPKVNIPFYFDYIMQWESPVLSSTVFLGSLLATYYFELYMVPLALMLVLLKSYIHEMVIKNINPASGPRYLESERKEESELDLFDDDKNENLSFKERWNEVQDGLIMMQYYLGFTASGLEKVKNCFNFTQPLLSWLAFAMLAVTTLIFYFVPFRYIIMLYIVKRFTKKLRTPHSVPNTEIIDFFSRVPSDEELYLYGEYKPETVTSNVADPVKRGIFASY